MELSAVNVWTFSKGASIPSDLALRDCRPETLIGFPFVRELRDENGVFLIFFSFSYI